MSASRLFRSFDGAAAKAAALKRHRLAVARGRVDKIREKVLTGAPLTDADHRILAKCGPKTLAYIGYQPKVTLQ